MITATTRKFSIGRLVVLRPRLLLCILILLLFHDDDGPVAHALVLRPPSSQSSASFSISCASSSSSSSSSPAVLSEAIATSSSTIDGDWARAKARLDQRDCCVVSVAGLDEHLKILQEHFVGAAGVGGTFADVDLRARVRIGQQESASSSYNQTTTTTYNDCLEICRAVRGTAPLSRNIDEPESIITLHNCVDPCAEALQELARGVASMDPSISSSIKNTKMMINKDVFVRVVVASTYQARDPPFHTDKAPFRGYVTLCGPGTDYMVRCCTSPLEYLSLRTMGTTLPSSFVMGGKDNLSSRSSLRRTPQLEFIVMKGDYYYSHHHHHHHHYESPSTSAATASSLFWMSKLFWQRTFACVHRSPPANTSSRRVIISLDLADGDDDREWYVVNKRREWRNGLTQRKSRLVA